jgi:hypothetical protein
MDGNHSTTQNLSSSADSKPTRVTTAPIYWDSAHSHPSAIERLTALAKPGAWRIALTFPDLFHEGHGLDVAKLCISWVDSAAQTMTSDTRAELDIAVGIAKNAIEQNVSITVQALGGFWTSQLSSELIGIVDHLLFGSRNDDCGSVFEACGYFLDELFKEVPAAEQRGLLDEILLDVERLFIRGCAETGVVAFVDGREQYAGAMRS